MYENVAILTNDNRICYVQTVDDVPKTIDNCTLDSGDIVTIKFGEGLVWAITNP